MCCYPWMGTLTKRFGIRRVSAGGAFLALIGTLPFLYLAGHGFVLAVLVPALFIRGMGLSAVGIPSRTSAYSSVKREELPMATTALNIIQRPGGPALTTLCATFPGWRLAEVHERVQTGDSGVPDLIGRFGTILLGQITRSTIDYCSFLNRSWNMS
jgi:hypothetical protein